MFATLGDREFRLISLAPAIRQDTVISIELLQCKINSAPVYDALSYVWGNQRHKVDIACNSNSQPVTVSENLHWALKRIRHRYEPRILWADAICINQEDLDERSHQVSIMGTIYSTARKVFLCMGEASIPGEDTDVAALVNGISALGTTQLWHGAVTQRPFRVGSPMEQLCASVELPVVQADLGDPRGWACAGPASTVRKCRVWLQRDAQSH